MINIIEKLKEVAINDNHDYHYNPYYDIHNNQDIIELVDILIDNTKDPNSKGGDEIYTEAQTYLLRALIGLVYKYSEIFNLQKNLPATIDLLFPGGLTFNNDNNAYRIINNSIVALMFKKLEEDGLYDSFAVKNFKMFAKTAGKHAPAIIISLEARLAIFDATIIREALS